MPDTNLPDIIKRVILEVETKNLSATAKEISKLSKMIQLLVKSNMSFSKAFDKTFEKGSKGLKKLTTKQKIYNKTVKNTLKLYDKWERKARRIGMSLAKGVIPFKSIEVLKKYNQQIIKASALMANHGVSVKNLKNEISNLQKTIKLTKVDMLGMLSAFELKAPVVSMTGFKDIMENIEKVTGSNKEAMDVFWASIYKIMDLVPSLQKDFEKITKEGKNRIKVQLGVLQGLKDITAEEARMINAYLKSSKKRNEIEKDELVTLGKFAQQMETIARMIASVLMPVLEKIADSFDKWGPSLKEFFDNFRGKIKEILKYSRILLELWAASKLVSIIAGWGMIMKGGMLAAGIGGGGAAAAGGVAVAGGTGFVAALGTASIALLAFVGAIGTTAIAMHLWWNNFRDAATAVDTMKKHGIGSNLQKDVKEAGFFDRIAAKRVFTDPVKNIKGEWTTWEKIHAKQEAKIATNKRKKVKKDIAEKIAKITGTEGGEVKGAATGPTDYAGQIKILNAKLALISKATEGQISNVAILSARMRLTGEIDPARLIKQISVTTTNLKDQKNLVKERLALSKKELSKIKPTNKNLDQRLNIQSLINADLKLELELENKIYDVTKNISKALETKLKLSQLDIQFASMRVQLADNFAIGVGASIKLRMQEYEANKANIIMQQKALVAVEKRIALNGINDELIAERKEAELSIMQSMMKQAQITRSIRDGWVEALMSMNSGAGVFSRIMMTQKKNTAQYLYTVDKAAKKITYISGSDVGGRRRAEFYTGRAGAVGGRGTVGVPLGQDYPTEAGDPGDLAGNLMSVFNKMNTLIDIRMGREKARGGTTRGFIGDISGYRLPAAVGGRKTIIVIEDRTEGGIKGAIKAGMAGQANQR